MAINKFSAFFDPSQAVERIDDYTPTTLVARTKANLPQYLILESLAQACGLHARWLLNFKAHVFLVSLAQCAYPAKANTQAWTIQATLQAQTSQALSYSARIKDGPTCTVTLGYQTEIVPQDLTTYFYERFQCVTTPWPSASN